MEEIHMEERKKHNTQEKIKGEERMENVAKNKGRKAK